jgi:hypothetical protein
LRLEALPQAAISTVKEFRGEKNSGRYTGNRVSLHGRTVWFHTPGCDTYLQIGVREAFVIFRDVQNILGHGYPRTRSVVLGPLSAHGERPDGTSRALCALGWLLAALFVTTSAGAQYRFAAWTADNGLPQNIIRGMHQTPDGYLWIATLDGVARFDGVHFTSSTKAIRPELPLTASVQWWEGLGGDLWYMSQNGRVTRYHKGSFQTHGREQGLPEDNLVRV